MGRGQGEQTTGEAALRSSTCDPALDAMFSQMQQGEVPEEELALDGITASPQGNGTSWLRLKAREGSAQKSQGKYLFFSTSPQTLLALALSEMRQQGFTSAKVSIRPSASDEHCLCLYWIDDTRGTEVSGRHPDVKFQGYKTNAATRAGIYSSEFLASRSTKIASSA